MIELLESRIAPAVLMPTLVKSTLTIMHDPGSGMAEDLLITQTGPGAFSVMDTVQNVSVGTFTGVKSITVIGSDLNDAPTFKFTGDGLAGNLTVDVKGGTNNVHLTSVDGAFGRIVGKVTITGGAGDDTLAIDHGLTIGNAVKFDGGTGSDHFLPDGTYLAKKLTLESVEDITTANAAAPVVIGSMLVENENANGAVIFVFSRATTVLGSLQYCGSGSVPDHVTLNGQLLGAVNLMLQDGRQDAQNDVDIAGTFASNLTITGGNGNDTILFHRVQIDFSMSNPQYEIAHVGGTLSMKLGNGTNDVTFADGSSFAKNVTLITGTGTDDVHFTDFIAAKNLTLTLGSGANTVSGPTVTTTTNLIGGKFSYTGTVDADSVSLSQLIVGTLSLKLGDGNNSVTGSDARINGSSATIIGGRNTDTITLGLGGSAARLTVNLLGGDDTFNFVGGALSSATLDGGTGGDTLTGLAALPANAKVKNFETKS